MLTLTSRFIFILLFLIPGLTTAQLSFGVKGGINFQYLRIERTFHTVEDYSGLILGGYAQMKMTKKFSFIPELQFSTRRYDVNVFAYDMYMGYAEIPLLFSYRPVNPVCIEAGPYVAFKIYGNSESNHEYPDEAFSKSVNAGLAAGLRLYITKKLAIVPRYWLGVTPVADQELFDINRQPIGKITAFNRVIETSLAWTL